MMYLFDDYDINSLKTASIVVYAVLTGCFVPENPGRQKQVLSCY